ncbi:MAG: SDR family oxidoreductase [Candidatus Eisenbacteria bacterium]|nr:SDR family oxidoreductase [Candidatus Eisenbacteria bacterium]
MGTLERGVAIITGAGRGIGAAIARRFAAEGASLVLAARTEAEIGRIAEEIRPLGYGAVAIPTDVTIPGSVQACVEGCLETFRRLDILVNAAGVQYISPVVLSDPERWFYDFDVNLFGTYRFCKACLPALADSQNGRIVNIASRMAKTPAPLNSAYSASKAGVVAFTAALAAEVARDGIRVNAICPGYVETKLLNDSIAQTARLTGRTPEEIKSALAKKSVFRRAVTAEEVAAVALFLVTEATGMTGQAINVTAGAEIH